MSVQRRKAIADALQRTGSTMQSLLLQRALRDRNAPRPGGMELPTDLRAPGLLGPSSRDATGDPLDLQALLARLKGLG